MKILRIRLASSLVFLLAVSANAQDAMTLGDITVDPPTLICLGFSWQIEGDANRNGSAHVEYRKAGEHAWQEALPLLRTGGFHVGRHWDWLDHVPPPRLGGSILDLEPETDYEVRLTARDPDGVAGEAVRTIRARTRGEPKGTSSGRVYHLYPPEPPSDWKTQEFRDLYDWKQVDGTKNQFNNLYKAYYGGSGNLGDFNMVWPRAAQPGDTILVHAGVYKAVLDHYTDATGVVADGTYWLTAKGTAEKPITIKAAGDGEVVFDGAGAGVLFNVMAADHHVFEDLTFRNCGTAIFAGQQRVGGCTGLTVRRCRFENVRDGIYTLWNGGENFYIADNVFLGRNAREGLTGWGGPESHFLQSNTAITLQGKGHVVCRNSIGYFWQGCHMGVAFQGFEQGGIACDIYENDLHHLIDDGVEIDGCVRNIRVLRNRIVNSGAAFSMAPVYGGPAYLIRNVAYNNRLGYKIHEAHPSGFLVYHNTVVGGHFTSRGLFTNGHFRNNLFLGHASHEPTVLFPAPLHGVRADSNGYDSRSLFKTTPLDALSPIVDSAKDPFVILRKYPPAGADTGFSSWAEFQKATGLETGGRLIDESAFASLRRSAGNSARHATRKTYYGSRLDFALNPKGAGVDAGVLLPNVNNTFAGSAPDLGALELRSELPQYGPAWLKGGFDFASYAGVTSEAGDPAAEVSAETIEGLKSVCLASVSDAVDQVTGKRGFLDHAMRPLAAAEPGKNLVGPAVTVQFVPNEKTSEKGGLTKALEAIDQATAGSVLVVSVGEDLNMTGIGGLMATTCHARQMAGAIIDGAARDVDEINKLGFPVFSRSISPATVIGRYTAVASNTNIICGGVPVEPGDLMVAGNDGVIVVPKSRAAEVLKVAREIDQREAAMVPLIREEKGILKAVEKFNRL